MRAPVKATLCARHRLPAEFRSRMLLPLFAVEAWPMQRRSDLWTNANGLR